MSWKKALKPYVPPKLWLSLALRQPRLRWEGDFSSWEEATRASTGYDAPAIVAGVERATQEVLAGRAAYERDGALFDEPSANLPLLAALGLAYAEKKTPFTVVDFGGALGSTFLQNRSWLKDMPLRWQVVEQKHFVEAGRRVFPAGPVQFFGDAKEGEREGEVFLLLSSVLQYLPDPSGTLASLVESTRPSWVFLDRVPYWCGDRFRLTVQSVPASMGVAAYPCWFFSPDAFAGPLSGYRKDFAFPALDHCPDLDSHFYGSFWRRNTAEVK